MLIEFVKRIILKHSLMQITWSDFKITWHTDNLLLSHQNTSPWQYIVSKVIFRIANRIFPLIKKSKIVIIVTFGTILRAPDHQEPLHQFFHLSSHVDLNTKMVSGVCVHVCACMYVRKNTGNSPHLALSLRQEQFVVGCCTCQPKRSMSFQRIVCLFFRLTIGAVGFLYGFLVANSGSQLSHLPSPRHLIIKMNRLDVMKNAVSKNCKVPLYKLRWPMAPFSHTALEEVSIHTSRQELPI